MTQVSRPMQILLLVTVLFGAVWAVALRPKPAQEGGAPAPVAQQAPDAPGAKGLTTAIGKAQGAVDTANRAGRKAAGEEPSTSGGATTGKTGAAATPVHKTAPAKPRHAVRTHHRSQAAKRHAARVRRANAAHVHAVRVGLKRHKAVAIAFVSPRIADARAVGTEIRHVSDFHRRAVVLAVPIGQLSDYDFITLDVQVTTAPTTVIVDRNGEATTIAGFADRVEIQQRLADALAVKRR